MNYPLSHNDRRNLYRQALEVRQRGFVACNIGFLNTAPFTVLSGDNSIGYIEATPAQCATYLREGFCDTACVPIADFVSWGNHAFFDVGIAAHGKVDSVLLFAQRPLEELQTIVVDQGSLTSWKLLRILLASLPATQHKNIRLYRADVRNYLDSIDNHTGVLVIGDYALKHRSTMPFEYDLAQLWHDVTGLPFVFAMWAVKPDKLTTPIAERFSALLRKGISNRVPLARAWAEQHNVDKELASSYVEHRIQYELNALALQGAEEFIRRGIELKLFPALALEQFRTTPCYHVHCNTRAPNQPALAKKPICHPPCIPGHPRRLPRSKLEVALELGSQAKRISAFEALALAENAPLPDLMLAADSARMAHHNSKRVSYIVSRNINYTNVCSVYCRFCAFSTAPGTDGYVLAKEEIGQKIQEAEEHGAVEILLQGGLNPELGIEYYEDLFSWIKSNYRVNLHALSSDEILHICSVSGLSIAQAISRLHAAGLGSIPGGGAEILVDQIRQQVSRRKSTSNEWLEVHRVAHHFGLPTTCTMMFGMQETWNDRISHLFKLRQLQDETQGFTAFIAWPFQDKNTKLQAGNTSVPEYLRVQAIARLFLDNVPNIQCSWVTQGASIGQVSLTAGANDFGSVMFEENVVASAGINHRMTIESIERHIHEAGYEPWQRDVRYQAVGKHS